jgi:hypothetical protein
MSLYYNPAESFHHQQSGNQSELSNVILYLKNKQDELYSLIKNIEQNILNKLDIESRILNSKLLPVYNLISAKISEAPYAHQEIIGPVQYLQEEFKVPVFPRE